MTLRLAAKWRLAQGKRKKMERERITISIKRGVLKAIDKTVDGINIRNRSHAIETLTSLALNTENTKNVVILLGGKDAMKSIPAVKEYLDRLAKNGFSKAYIAVGFLSDKIKDKLGNGEDFGVKLEYLEEGEGSGGALLQLKKLFNNTFVTINTDEKFNVDFNDLIEYHKKHQATATIATNNLDTLKGIYIFDPVIFNQIPKDFSMLESDIFPKLLKENKLIVRPLA